MKEQLLDQMDLERERGITIKLQPVRMTLTNADLTRIKTDKIIRENIPPKSASSSHQSAQIKDYVLNLIDTPGHTDFNYEVSRSLAAVEGAILLADAVKGVQAQTLSNLYLAIEQGLEIIPVINKIDLPNAEIEKTKKEIIQILGCKSKDILLASGKTGEGVEKIINAVLEKIPYPKGRRNKPLRALIFDSKYDTYKGVLAYVRIVDGEIKRDGKILMMAVGKETSVVEVGYFKPALMPCDILKAGDIGYIATGLKRVEYCRMGDTITQTNTDLTRINTEKNSQCESVSSLHPSVPIVKPLAGYKKVKPAVYASFYPLEGEDYAFMKDALGKLKLNDAAFDFEPESNLALGKGFRCGFLGMLHLEIIQARLKKEFNLSPTITTPSVVYKIKLTTPQRISLRGRRNSQLATKKEISIYSPADMPDPSVIEKISEPYVELEIITPSSYLGQIMELMNSLRSNYKDTEYIDQKRVILKYEAPLMDIIVNFHDDLKSVSSGFASMSYQIIGYRVSDLVKLDILIAGDKIDALSRIVPRKNILREGKLIIKGLKGAIPRQNFAVALQAAVGGTIVARETIKPFRKDVTSGLYGGDITRKRKLLEKQKKGKKKMKNIGKVSIPPEAFLAALKK